MEWQDIKNAPIDGTEVWVYAAPCQDLEGFQCACAYHPDGGWCVDELREVTHWMPIAYARQFDVIPPPSQEK